MLRNKSLKMGCAEIRASNIYIAGFTQSYLKKTLVVIRYTAIHLKCYKLTELAS